MSANYTPNPSGYVRGPMNVLEDFRLHKLPRWFVYIAIVAVIASWVPLAFIFKATFNKSTEPRISIMQDMGNQPKFRPQDENELFADKRAMRPVIAGTVARGQLHADVGYNQGFIGMGGPAGQPPAPQFIAGYPAEIQTKLDNASTAETFIRRGQNRFNIYCAVCHGADGLGAGQIHIRADQLTKNGVQGMSWVQPKNLHEDAIRGRPNGHIYNTITNGIRNMGSYASQIEPEDRWAIVAYVRALQFSRTAQPSAVPDNQRDVLK